jgi:hypothetical protein
MPFGKMQRIADVQTLPLGYCLSVSWLWIVDNPKISKNAIRAILYSRQSDKQ